MIKRYFGLLLAALALAIGTPMAAPNLALAQPSFGGGEQQPQSPQLTAKDSFEIASQENKTLETIMHSINSIDTARQNELIQWIITDRTIRSRVISALRKGGYSIRPNSIAEMTVTQKPPTGDNSDMALLRIVVEQTGIYGEPRIRQILGSTLYDEINSRQGYEFTLISTEQEQQKIQFLAVNASLFGGDIIFKSGFGFGLNLGDDYIGYPFWLPGTIGTYGLIRNGVTDFRIGIEWPLGQSGIAPFTISQGLAIRERKLAGAMAFAAEVKQDLGLLAEQSGKLHFGLEFRDAFTPNINSFPSYALAGLADDQDPYATGTGGSHNHGAKDSLYYLALSAHAYVEYRTPNQFLSGGYVQLGGGMHSIQPVTVGVQPIDPANPNTDLDFDTRQNFFDPFIKLGYIRTGESGDEYGISVQYSNELLTDAWVQLFSWLQLEAKYSTVIGRDPYPWEWKDYVMVSPKIILNF
ncbi:MAG TPA: hypothetical protein VGM92_04000 [Candidatus Kapabacteria bacterium]|jgi:hypothetical protein